MKENQSNRIVIVVSQKAHWSIMLFLFILVMNTEEYFWMKSYGWACRQLLCTLYGERCR